MAEQNRITISWSDIESVAQKMEHFDEQLPPNEQLVVSWLLERAASADTLTASDEDVRGYLGPASLGGTQSLGQLSGSSPRMGAFSDTFRSSLGLGGISGSWQNKAGGVGIGLIY